MIHRASTSQVTPGERYITVPYVRPGKQRALPSISALNDALHSVTPHIAREAKLVTATQKAHR